MRPVCSWGRLSNAPHDAILLNHGNDVAQQLRAHTPGIAYGMGRSYGDACLNPGGAAWITTGLDHFIDFDESSGKLACEAGVLLRDIQHLIVPRGWMLPVSPGTQLITVGGAIANDVHGKNHHRFGSFGDQVNKLRLLRTSGEIIECSTHHHPDWFSATIGGLGLTGLIVEAELQLRRIASPWLNVETLPYANLKQFFEIADGSDAEWEHTVSWIDCLSGSAGRGIFMRANPASNDRSPPAVARKLTVPPLPPISIINQLTLRPFNAAYYHLNRLRTRQEISFYESFFYPLDNIYEWNRIYGPRGFYQYQSVVPRDVGLDATRAMLEQVTRSGQGSFLAVLKTFADRPGAGMLSFPREGVTLALDFPNQGAPTLKLFERLDAVVRDAGGRIYAAKDARMPRDLFESGYPRIQEFLGYRDSGISSALSRRLMGN